MSCPPSRAQASGSRASHEAADATSSGKRSVAAKHAVASATVPVNAPKPPKAKPTPQRVPLGSSPPSRCFAGLSKAPEPAALPLPSFGFGLGRSTDSAPGRAPAPHPPAQPLSAGDASTQLRQLLAIPMPSGGPIAQPQPSASASTSAAQHSLALRQLLGVAAC